MNKYFTLCDEKQRIVRISENAQEGFKETQFSEKPLYIYDNRGIPCYRKEDGNAIRRTQEEMDADYAARPASPPSDKERITALEAQLAAYEAAYAEGVSEA